MKQGASGFTLIELMVTLAIVALLSSLAMPLTQLVAKRAKEHELRANLRQVRDALDHYNEVWRYSCLPAGSGFGAAPAPGASAPGNPVGGSVTNAAGGAPAGNVAAGGTAGSISAAGLGGSGGVSASTVTSIGGTAGGVAIPTAVPPKMECLAGSSGWPKDLQVLVDGVKNVASATPEARIFFLRRIPRDPFFPDGGAQAIDTWGKRSSASTATEPQEGDDIYDIYSLSTANDLTGQPYRDW